MRSPLKVGRRVSIAFLVLGTLIPLGSLVAAGPGGVDIEKWSEELQGVNKGLQAPCPTCEVASSPATSSGLCNDLYRFTCAPGEYNDGTGTASTAGAAESKVTQVRQQAKDYFAKQFDGALKKPENDYFRKMALSAFGLTYSPACEDAKQSSKECNALLTQGLNDLAMKRIFPDPSAGGAFGLGPFGMGAGFGGQSLRDIDLLIQNPAYQEVERNLASYARSQLQDQKAIDKIQNSIFPEVRKLVAKVIGDSVSDPKTKQSLTTKVSAIRFAGTDCSQLTTGMPMPGGDANNPSISSLLIPNAFYDPQTNTFRYCNGFLLSSQSEFHLLGLHGRPWGVWALNTRTFA